MRTTVSLRGDREIRKVLDSLSGNALMNRTRRAVRSGAAVMRRDLRARVRSGPYPKTFEKIKTKNSTHGIGGSPKTSVGPTSSLINIFEGGAGSHTIRPKHGHLLAGPAGDHFRGSAFVAAGPVSHPGMAARPLIEPTFEATKDEATKAAMETLLDGLR